MRKNSGLSLIELLIYVGVFSVVAGLLSSMLIIVTRVQNQQTAAAEVGSQLNFVLQVIQRMIRQSSVIVVNNNGNPDNDMLPLGSSYSNLVLRMSDQATDPTKIYLLNNKIYLQTGNDAPTPLTTDKILADSLQFTKYANYPGHDTVSIDITLSFNTQNPQLALSRTLRSAISRVSAATFDSSLVPGAGNAYDVGQSTARWRKGNFSGSVDVAEDLTVGAANGSSGYLQFRRFGSGAPTDTCTDTERGRLYIDTLNNRLYLCNGDARGWDYIPLVN